MKIIFGLVLLFVLAGCGFSQTVKPKSVLATTEETKPADDGSALVANLQTAQNALYKCYSAYFESKESNKLEIVGVCTKKASGDLAETYTLIAKNPNALALLMAAELENNYQNGYGGYTNKTQTETESQTKLQRIIILQNQRIIELLEQLLKKK